MVFFIENISEVIIMKKFKSFQVELNTKKIIIIKENFCLYIENSCR